MELRIGTVLLEDEDKYKIVDISYKQDFVNVTLQVLERSGNPRITVDLELILASHEAGDITILSQPEPRGFTPKP